MSRRDFVAGAMALGVSASLTGKALADVPKRGGHLIVGISAASTTDTLDPAHYVAEYPQFIGPQLYDQLTTVDAHLKVQPALATSWDSKNAAKDWVFKLRKGVHFHNGKEMTAADVVHSINHHRDKDSKSVVRSIVAPITEIKATDKYEVSISFAGGNVGVPALLSDLRLCIGPEESNFTDGVGTGAFTLVSFEPGVRMQSKRNPNDWRSDRGYVDSVETLGINDANARLSALISRSVHLIERVEPTGVTALEAHPEMQVFNTTGAGHDVFAMFVDTAPFDNADLRLALKYGIDRQTMLRQLLHGYGRIGNDHPVPTFDPFYAADIPQWPYDPEKAAFYAKRSGYSGPIELTVANTAFNGAVDAAQIFQAAAAKAGINIQINRVPNDGYWSNVWLKKPFVASYWGGRPTLDNILSTVYASGSPSNETHWNRPKFDQLLVAARGEFDYGKRKQMYHDLQLMLHQEGGAVIPVFTNFIDAGSKQVKGFVPMPTHEMSGNRAAERVWFG